MFLFKKKEKASKEEQNLTAVKRLELEDLLQELFLRTATAETGEYVTETYHLNKTGEHDNLLEFMYGAGKDGKYTVMMELFNSRVQREVIVTILNEKKVSASDVDEALTNQRYAAKRVLTDPLYTQENFDAIKECFAEATEALWQLS